MLKSLTNLVTNAAEAMPPGGGAVTICAALRTLTEPVNGYMQIAPGRYGLIEARDEGSGIPPEDQERVFEPFFTQKPMGRSGSGLGMAVVWGAMKDHQGFIDLESRVGEGTRISLYFPLNAEADAALPALPSGEETTRGKGQRILVVDDAPEQREIASEMLQFLGYRPFPVDSGESALTWLEQNTCELVVLDMLMAPGIDGLETYRRIAAAYSGLKVIVASGFSEESRREEARRLGVNAFMAKPYGLDRLAATLRRVLQPD